MTFKTIFILWIALNIIGCKQQEFEQAPPPPSPPSQEENIAPYIPKDLDDCFNELDKLLSDSTKKSIKNKTESRFSAESHFGLGLTIRNIWIRTNNSRLRSHFNSKGINHPDDMSGIILVSYYRYLTNKVIRFDEQIKHYQNYWNVTLEPKKNTYPKGVKIINFDYALDYVNSKNGEGCIHIGKVPKSSIIWLYDYYFGWTKVTELDITNLENNKENREEILKKIFKKNKR
jgi:hypothetical protein